MKLFSKKTALLVKLSCAKQALNEEQACMIQDEEQA